jgi:hypothetical protein
MINRPSFTLTALVTCALGLGLTIPLEAQQWEERIPGSAGEWGVQNLRPRGQPVVPIFDGWVAEEDGTASLCFGYFNLNYDEALEIPVGPNNYMEPEEYNGLQPTRFNPVPLDGGDKPRHYCVFKINVPQGGGQDIVWTLRRHYQDYSVPANSGSLAYRVSDIYFPTDRAERGGSVVPIVRFVEPDGPEGIGKGLRGGRRVGPLSAQVGRPLTLTLAVRQPTAEEYPELADYDGGERVFGVSWQKYSGPPDIFGNVNFSNNFIEVGPVEGTATTQATFEEPGDYVLLVQVLGGGYPNQCCWTNGYVEVNVSP